MLFQFLQKQKNRTKKKKLLETMILSLHIQNEEKRLYIQALHILKNEELEELYIKMTKFIEKSEVKELEDISKQSFTTIAGMKKKEAEEKTQDINALSFLFHNL